ELEVQEDPGAPAPAEGGDRAEDRVIWQGRHPSRPPNEALRASCGLVFGGGPPPTDHRRGVGPNQVITVGPRGVVKPNPEPEVLEVAVAEPLALHHLGERAESRRMDDRICSPPVIEKGRITRL